MKKITIIFAILIISISVFYFNSSSKTSSKDEFIVGAKNIQSTPISKGTIFISTEGNGTNCTEIEPCALNVLDMYSKNRIKIKAGDVLFFRGGTYKYAMNGVKRVYLPGGTKDKPIIYESYPNEIAIFDGSLLSREDNNKKEWREGRLELRENHTILRKIEIKNMPRYGLRVYGNYNIVEGCSIHGNGLSGIQIHNYKDNFSQKDTGGSHNTIRNNIIYNNSDVGLLHNIYNDGDNADGITIHSGIKNIIAYNTIYDNSDDGIDTWKSMNTIVEYNFTYNQGKGKKGNGNGIKLGGAEKKSPLGSNNIARYNISHSNRNSGITTNTGKNVLIEYNSVYNNKKFGYTLENDTRLNNNVSFKNGDKHVGWDNGSEQTNNSWQKEEEIEFVSLDPNSLEFLKPKKNIFKDMGVYAKNKN